MFFLLFLPVPLEPPGRLGRRGQRSGCVIVAGMGAGLGKLCGGKTSDVPVETETVLDRELDFPLVVGGWRLKVVSTSSSSNFLRFIVLEELNTNGVGKFHFSRLYRRKSECE